MTLHAVQDYAAGIANGLTSPGWTKPLVAQVMVPNPGLLRPGEPQLFVWGASWTEKRTTIPRATPGINPMLTFPGDSVDSGWKERPYAISAWLYGVQQNSDRDGTKFPVLIEQLMNAYRMTSVPAYLVDSVTGEQSKLMNIGEVSAGEYDVDRTLADQRLVRNECRIDIEALELFQF